MSGRRSWGWHPLTADWADRVVGAADLDGRDLVLDLGAGDGALTRPLLATGARVIAVELHRGRAASLTRRFGDHPRLTVRHDDVLRVPLPRRGFHVVASPPYGVSTGLVRRLAAADGLVTAHLVVQRQFARRLIEGGLPGARGLRRFDVRVVHPLPRRAFTPPPRVDSVLLALRRGQRGARESPMRR